MVRCYRDIEYFGSGGGGYDDVPVPVVSEKVNEPTPPPLQTMHIVELRVTGQGTLNTPNYNDEKVIELHKMFELSKNNAEFESFRRIFREQKKLSLEEFVYYILALREINNILPTSEQINLSSIGSTQQLELIFLNLRKYLIFSENTSWLHHCDQIKYIKENFSDKDIKRIVQFHLPESTGSITNKIVQNIRRKGHFSNVIKTVKVWLKNQKLFLEYDIDYNAINLRSDNDWSEFVSKIEDLKTYQLLNKIFQRLNSNYRQEIKSHQVLLNSFLEFCRIVINKNIPFEKINSVLSQQAAFKSVNELHRVLNGIISNVNIFELRRSAQKIDGAKVAYFNEYKGILIVKIKNYRAMQELGSDCWCVQRSIESFRSYKSYGIFGSTYYIIFNSNLPANDDDSVIGITARFFGQIFYAFNGTNRNVLENVQQEYGRNIKTWIKNQH